MEAENKSLPLIIEIPNVQVYKVVEHNKDKIAEGTLQLAEVTEGESYILSVGDFKYNLSKQIPVLAKRLGKIESLYIVPDVEGNIGIHLPEETKNVDLFESVLRDIAQLAFEEEEVHAVEETPEEAAKLVKQHSVDDHVEKELDPRTNAEGTNYVAQYITMAGDFIKDGISKIAVLAATGLSNSATYVSEKYITKGPDYKVGGVTYHTVKGAKNLTDKAVNFKEKHVTGAMTVTAKIVVKLHGMFERSAAGKAITSTDAYKQVQDVGVAAIYATSSVYDSMSDAMDTLSGTFSNATTDIVRKRFGDRAGDATSATMGAFQNISKLMKGVRQGTVKTIAKGVSAQKVKEAKKDNEEKPDVKESAKGDKDKKE